jgi:hypothetical protein
MMKGINNLVKPERTTRRKRLIVVTGLAVVVLLAATISVTLWWSGGSHPGTLVVEPKTVELTDRVFGEGEYVKFKFRIHNPFDRAVTVTAISTTCGCLAAEVEGGSPPPFVIEPKKTAEFWLKAGTMAMQQSVQEFLAFVAAERDGKRLADAVVSLRFKVEDPLRSFPASIAVGGAPTDQPIQRKLVLGTRSDSVAIPAPELQVSSPDAIRAELAQRPPGANVDEIAGFKTRLVVDVTILPHRGSPAITGGIKVLSKGRLLAYIPVECTFKQDYRLSQEWIDAEGLPGESVVRELYYEPHDPEWRDIEAVSLPSGLELKVEPFDSTTKVLRMKIRMPDLAGDGSAEAERGLVLRTLRGQHLIKIPIRYKPARS